MKLKLPLPRLPDLLGALRVRRGGGRFDHASSEGGPIKRLLRRLPLPTPFISAVLFTVGIAIGVGLWLWLNAEQTVHERAAAVPSLTVTIAGGAPLLPIPPLPNAAEHHGDSHAEGQGHGAPATDHDHHDPAAEGKAHEETHGDEKPDGPGPDEAFPLAKAPASGLTEDSRNGPLPVIASDGRQAWQVYARPYKSSKKRGRIALIINQMGIAGATTGLALQRLPPGVTLGFAPVADRLEGWVEASRGQGHEVILTVPMEPLSYPHDDPGPNTLLLALDGPHNLDRLEWAFGRFSGYIGITSPSGSRFGAENAAMRTVLEAAKKRGLMFLDAGVAPGAVGFRLAIELNVPRAKVDRIIDRDPSRAGIDNELKALETIAQQDGVAIGMGDPLPITLERVAKWIPLLPDKNLILTPLSATANLQKLPEPEGAHDEAGHGEAGHGESSHGDKPHSEKPHGEKPHGEKH